MLLKRLSSLWFAMLLTACVLASDPDPQPRETDAATTLAAELAMPRPIAARHSYWMEELTWMEVRDAVANGSTTVIVPTGGVEQNGPYLSTGKHNVILEATCPVIAEQLGNALCAPVVKFVPEGNIEPPTGLMMYPGTISVSEQTFEFLLDDIASSLKQAGFSDVVLIGDSGGNQAGMARVADKLNKRWARSAAKAHFIGEYYDPGWVATEKYTKNELGVWETQHDGFHDDIWVTAMMMVVDANAVRHEERVAAGLASINGVSLMPLAHLQSLGTKMIEFRARLTAKAIQKSIALP